jgi:hypothetical protein
MQRGHEVFAPRRRTLVEAHRILCCPNKMKRIEEGLLARPEGLEPPAYWFEAKNAHEISDLV